MLYFAYGSNLNKAAMVYRCPAAKPLAPYLMRDARLIFRGVADCIEEPGAVCPGAIWQLTVACERSLDHYEGVAAGMYRKVHLPIVGVPDEDQMLIYVMNSTGIMPPSQRYLDTIVEGYRDFGLPVDHLREAVRLSWQNKHKTYSERRRRHRDGYAPLAKADAVPQTGKAATGKRAATKRSKSK